ncbi:MAG: hypothetical protein JXO72_06595 [Vicinamibacteria bacterium]|nr:hypothetical protein [Vicinamibacteria bacterium]
MSDDRQRQLIEDYFADHHFDPHDIRSLSDAVVLLERADPTLARLLDELLRSLLVQRRTHLDQCVWDLTPIEPIPYVRALLRHFLEELPDDEVSVQHVPDKLREKQSYQYFSWLFPDQTNAVERRTLRAFLRNLQTAGCDFKTVEYIALNVFSRAIRELLEPSALSQLKKAKWKRDGREKAAEDAVTDLLDMTGNLHAHFLFNSPATIAFATELLFRVLQYERQSRSDINGQSRGAPRQNWSSHLALMLTRLDPPVPQKLIRQLNRMIRARIEQASPQNRSHRIMS